MSRVAGLAQTIVPDRSSERMQSLEVAAMLASSCPWSI
jgi:hypothetical protein